MQKAFDQAKSIDRIKETKHFSTGFSMQNIFHTKYAFTLFIGSFLTYSTAFSMEEELRKLESTYSACKNSCKQKGKHHKSSLYGSVVRPDYAYCAKICEREFKTNVWYLKNEQRSATNRLLLQTGQSRNQ